ncbi:hypothetical protein DSECCO2_315390 [anaerobic digester metagenome]
MNYPMNLMLLFMDMEGMPGPDLENGLVNFKKKYWKPPEIKIGPMAVLQFWLNIRSCYKTCISG